MNSQNLLKLIFFIFVTFHTFKITAAPAKILTGSINGQVVDADTKAPLFGTNVVLAGTQLGAATDAGGQFVIKNVPVGNYILHFHYIGYEPLKKTNIIVKSKRIAHVSAALKMSALAGEAVTVTGGYFAEVEDQPTSIINFSYEEIRWAPGSGGDVSRIIMGLPSIAKVNDQTNNLIVRGGSPVENAFFIDNIEIPNINHFPTQGSSGGSIGLINVDFIQDVNFYSGGFSAIYGDRLSSIMEITFREGNREEFDGQLDLNFAGFGGIAEGPLPLKKGSWLISARRSYLDWVVQVLDVGSTVAPRYGDFQGKIVYDLNPNHKLMFVWLWGDDHNAPDREIARENDMIYYGNQDIYENTTGLNWRALWRKRGYSNSSLAYTSTRFKEKFWETSTGDFLIQNLSHEQDFKFRNVNRFRLNHQITLEFGLDARYLSTSYDNFYAAYTDALGDSLAEFTLNEQITAQKLGAFANYLFKPFPRFSTTVGLRADYFSFNKNWTFAPRLAFSYQLTELTSINGSSGLFYQHLPLILLYQNQANRELTEPLAKHYILGIEHLLTENTKLTLELYQKDYQNFPLDPNQPALFLIDELYYRYGFFFNHGPLQDQGKAYSRGIELLLQKKLAQDFYGLVSASYFRTRYQGGDGVWRDRVFDNRVIFSVEGGYKPNKKWEFSARWIYAGGAPFTPFDLAASQENQRQVLDVTKINQSRYPDYHSLNLRFDRRFHFSGSNLIFYFSVWNAYNRKNVATYFWNDQEQKPDVIYQWRVLPIFGLEYEF